MNDGKTITLTTAHGERFSGYIAGPEAAPCAILILHEWWGLLPHNRQWADDFATEGYRALAIDLYDGRTTDDPAEAGQWMREIDQETADRKLSAAIDHLGTGGRKVVTYGGSFGGREAQHAAMLRPDAVIATVVAFSRMETDVERLRRLGGPVFVIYATQERTWPEKQHAFEQAMKDAGQQTHSLQLDAAHGFTNPSSPRFDAAATAEAWQATLAFLRSTCAPHRP